MVVIKVVNPLGGTMATEIKMTEKEKAMIIAIINSNFGYTPTSKVPMICVMPDFGTSAGGIMASLSKKGWAHSEGRCIGGELLHDDEGYVWLTDAGVEAITEVEMDSDDDSAFC